MKVKCFAKHNTASFSFRISIPTPSALAHHLRKQPSQSNNHSRISFLRFAFVGTSCNVFDTKSWIVDSAALYRRFEYKYKVFNDIFWKIQLNVSYLTQTKGRFINILHRFLSQVLAKKIHGKLGSRHSKLNGCVEKISMSTRYHKWRSTNFKNRVHCHTISSSESIIFKIERAHKNSNNMLFVLPKLCDYSLIHSSTLVTWRVIRFFGLLIF